MNWSKRYAGEKLNWDGWTEEEDQRSKARFQEQQALPIALPPAPSTGYDNLRHPCERFSGNNPRKCDNCAHPRLMHYHMHQ